MAVLGQMTFWQGLLGFAIVIMAGLLIIVILLQRGRGDGLSGAFGGSGGSSAFGAKTGDVFTWITVVVATLVVVLAVVSNYVFDESPKLVQAADLATDGDGPGGDAALPIRIETVPVLPVEITGVAGDAPEAGSTGATRGDGEGPERSSEEPPSP